MNNNENNEDYYYYTVNVVGVEFLKKIRLLTVVHSDRHFHLVTNFPANRLKMSKYNNIFIFLKIRIVEVRSILVAKTTSFCRTTQQFHLILLYSGESHVQPFPNMNKWMLIPYRCNVCAI